MNRARHRNFDNDSCCEAYCPCCPQCNCDCNCNCECNCTKKKMIVPTFILSGLSFIFIIIEMITKVSDTDTYIKFKQLSYIEFRDIYGYKYDNDYDEMLDIQKSEDRFSLSLFIVSIFIFLIYLILLICFIYENVCFADYNPKCKKPYYLLMMILNFVACLINIIISFIFFTYRISSIDTFKDYSCFTKDFRTKNDLNISLNVLCIVCYILCLFFHLITCYYLFKEDGICGGCCNQFIYFINCCGSCLKCFFCCCCCCCERQVNTGTVVQRPVQRNVVILPSNTIPVIPYNANNNYNVRIPYLQSSLYQENSQYRNYMNNEIKTKIERNCNSAVYGNNYSEFKKCPICKDDFIQGVEIIILPCGHVLHKNCAFNWFISSKNCPEDGTFVLN